LSVINVRDVTSDRFEQFVKECFGSGFERVTTLDEGDTESLGRYASIPFGTSTDEAYLAYLIVINTDFFLATDQGFLGVFHYSKDTDFIVHFFDEEIVEIIGDSAASWAANLFPPKYQASIDKFKLLCQDEFGVVDSEYDVSSELSFDFNSWTPLKR
jgi:hypothetical protein